MVLQLLCIAASPGRYFAGSVRQLNLGISSVPVIDDCRFDTDAISGSLKCELLITVVFPVDVESVGVQVSDEHCWFYNYCVLQHLPADTSQAQ